ncbi:MAG: hypothetical protein AAF541_00840 [Pseudomonadota bacterium]
MKAGPFVPDTADSMRISMAGDDCSLHFDLNKLTPKQQADHLANQVLTGMLQLALMYIAKPDDEVNLYQQFDQSPWRDAFDRYLSMFARMDLLPNGPAQMRFHPVDQYYKSVAQGPLTQSLECLYMTSGSNKVLHQSEAALAVSQDLNSKIHFAEHAPAAGLPVPATLVTNKAALAEDAEEVSTFLGKYKLPLMLKTLGLAGARNVTVINSIDEASDYLSEYPDDAPLILQQRLSSNDYVEMTVDLSVTPDDIKITNVRKILFAEGLWVGNLLGAGVALTQAQETALLEVGEYARDHLFVDLLDADQAYNLGIDYFIRAPQADNTLPPVIITEINARWTGGLFPAELVRRLGIRDQSVVAFIDLCPVAEFETYLNFLEANLYSASGDSSWSIAPMGFSPLPQDLEGFSQLYVWQIVIGDFEAFKASRYAQLDSAVLPTAPIISIDIT